MNLNYKNILKRSVAICLLLIASVSVFTLIFNLIVSLIINFAGMLFISIIWTRLSFNIRRKITENIFIIITGMSVILIISTVIYLLLNIYLNSQGKITWEFLVSNPTEGLTEGGIFPAIIGTALLVILMSLAGVPIGTITAIYLTEYAKATSKIARFIRFAVNTLAGVPAIVFGLFGLGFFIGTIGNSLDKIEYNNRINKLENIFNSKNSPFIDDGRAKISEIERLMIIDDKDYWMPQLDLIKTLGEKYPAGKDIDKNTALKFFGERQRPKWGQPSIIWAALTMALLTLPVVIVSVEEAIKGVPVSMREASLALGATKFRTLISVVIPGSITGILTGGILAVSRGAGEVAPILFTGAAYYLPELPTALNSQFMELGYHIYVLSTQSTNVDQTLPLQYATTFVLLILTFTLNFAAIFLRSKIRTRLAR